MLKVSYSDDELITIKYFNDSVIKSGSDWLDERFDAVKKSIKKHYLKEQSYTCYFCKQHNKVTHHRAWDTEHIISRSSHPAFMFEPENLCVICIDCNLQKSGKEVLSRPGTRVKLPKTSSAYSIIHPHIDIYEEHIHVIVAGEIYEYKSPKGLKTMRTYGLDRFFKFVERSQLTDPGLNRLRKLAITSKDSNEDYKSIELELFEYLAVKYSAEVGHSLSFDVVKKIKDIKFAS